VVLAVGRLDGLDGLDGLDVLDVPGPRLVGVLGVLLGPEQESDGLGLFEREDGRVKREQPEGIGLLKLILIQNLAMFASFPLPNKQEEDRLDERENH